VSSGARKTGRLIAFEGVDGAGKSTALALVASKLVERGVSVFLPRKGKDHVSRPARSIRDLTRDRRQLDLVPRAELLLYCAREAQLLAELVRPALARGETVLIDRSLLTPTILGRARGLGRDECEHAAGAAAAGLAPDLTLVFDVHPRTARLRKRLERIRKHGDEEGGRKGLAGSAFKERVRELYLTEARERGFPVLYAERASPSQLADRSLRLIDGGAQAKTGQDESDRAPLWLVADDFDLPDALASVPLPIALFMGNGLICARSLRRAAAENEPALCAFTLDPDDPLRDELAELEPDYAMRAYTRRPLSGPDDLRLRLLARFPAAVLRSLRHLTDPQSDALRMRFAESHPDAVLTSLAGREDETGVTLRQRLWPLASDRARAASLTLCRGEAAWSLRETLLEQDPALGLQTLRGVPGDRTQAWLERYAETAPKTILAALAGRADARAYALRTQLRATGREVVESVRGLDDEAAWAIREQALPLWPSTVANSLLGLENDPRAQRMAAHCYALAKGDIHVLRRLQRLAENGAVPLWAQARRSNPPPEDFLDD
jgi:dTMP kinase